MYLILLLFYVGAVITTDMHEQNEYDYDEYQMIHPDYATDYFWGQVGGLADGKNLTYSQIHKWDTLSDDIKKLITNITREFPKEGEALHMRYKNVWTDFARMIQKIQNCETIHTDDVPEGDERWQELVAYILDQVGKKEECSAAQSKAIEMMVAGKFIVDDSSAGKFMRSALDSIPALPSNNWRKCFDGMDRDVDQQSTHAADPSYLGCYSCNPTSSSCPSSFVQFKDQLAGVPLTPESCKGICFAKGMPFSGLGNGNICFCAEVAPSDSEQVAETECNVPCSENSHQMCGGSWRISYFGSYFCPIMREVGFDDFYVGKSKYLGCFHSGLGDLQLMDLDINLGPVHGVEKCRKVCGSLQYAFAASNKVTECSCSNDFESHAHTKLPDAACRSPCPNGDKMCGGPQAASVFKAEIINDH